MLYKNYLKSLNVNTKKRKKSDYTISYFLLNYIANFLIAVLLRLKVKPDTITNINLINYLISLILIYFYQKENFYIYGIYFYILTLLIDKCDGGLARIYKYKTFFGKFYDGLIDMIFPPLFFLGLTLTYYFKTDDLVMLFIGCNASIFFLLDIAVLDKFSAITRWCNKENNRNSKPYLKKNYFGKLLNFMRQDLILIALILISLNSIENIYQKYFFLSIYLTFYLSGLYNLTLHYLIAKKNLRIKKK